MIEIKDYKRYFPNFTTPNGTSQIEYLRQTVFEQVKIKYGNITDEIKTRIEYELSVYEKFDYVNCVLVIADLINGLKHNGAEFSCAGTQSGSIINYLLGITEDDPIKYGFLFERYISDDEPYKARYPFYCLHSDSKNIGKIIKIIKNKYGKYSIIKTKPLSYSLEDYIFGINLEELDIFDKTKPHKKQCVLSSAEAASIGLFGLTIFNEQLLNILTECKRTIKDDLNFNIDSCTDLKTWEYLSSGKFVNPEFTKPNAKKSNPIIEEIFKDRYRVYLHNLEELSEFISIGGFGDGYPTERNIRAYRQYKSLIMDEKLIFQEDGMKIIRKLTGRNLAECNTARKRIARNNVTDIMQHKFICDAVKNGYTEKYAEEILEELKHKLLYLKTKTWCLFYAFILYQLAYISLYYPEEYAKII